jgi:hypothetical protein
VQKQAATLAEKDSIIAKLKQQLKQVESLLPSAPASSIPSPPHQPGRGTGPAVNSETEASRPIDATSGALLPDEVLSAQLLRGYAGVKVDEDEDWESLPVPETFKQALEQILMLQVCTNPISACQGGAVLWLT